MAISLIVKYLSDKKVSQERNLYSRPMSYSSIVERESYMLLTRGQNPVARPSTWLRTSKGCSKPGFWVQFPAGVPSFSTPTEEGVGLKPIQSEFESQGKYHTEGQSNWRWNLS